jgi:ferric-dicitrate binding protein FerR (iron transport regulator)
MSEFERALKAVRLAAPSAALDQRMNETFAAAARTPQRLRKPMLSWWLAGVGAFGAAAACLLVLQWSHPPSPVPIEYRFEARGRMRQLLLDPPTTANQLPHFEVSTSSP